MGMHASRLVLSLVWIAIVQGIVTTGTPAGNVALLVMAVSFLALTLFALIMAIKGV
jgi:hypothetical protein